MSSETNCQTSGDVKYDQYLDAIHDIIDLGSKRFTKPLMLVDFIFKLSPMGKQFYKAVDISHKTTRKIIEQRRLDKATQSADSKGKDTAVNSNSKGKLLDFIDILLEAKDESGVGLTDLEIREEI